MLVSAFGFLSFAYYQGAGLFNFVYLTALIIIITSKISISFKNIFVLLLLVFLFLFSIFRGGIDPNYYLNIIVFYLGLLAISGIFVFYPSAKISSLQVLFYSGLLVSLLYIFDAFYRVSVFVDFGSELAKRTSFLGADSNATAYRWTLFSILYFQLCFFKSRIFLFFFLLLSFLIVLSTFSRAGILLFILLHVFLYFFLFKPSIFKFLVNPFITSLFLFFISYLFVLLFEFDILPYDSSLASRYSLIVGSLDIFINSDLFEILFGHGLYSNINVAPDDFSISWSSGHSLVYYSLIEFGLVGSFLLLFVFFNRSISFAKGVFVSVLLVGVFYFRADFLFLFVYSYIQVQLDFLRRNSLFKTEV